MAFILKEGQISGKQTMFRVSFAATNGPVDPKRPLAIREAGHSDDN
jgi:hypothetical protein